MIGVDLQIALDAFPLEDWIKEIGFRRSGRAGAGPDEWTATCPRCRKPQKLVVNLSKRAWHCWVCQRFEIRHDRGYPRRVTAEGGGGPLRLVAWWYGCSVGEAALWLLRIPRLSTAHVPLPEFERAVEWVHEGEGDEELVPPPPPEGACPLTDDNLSYLAGRGLSGDVARAYGLFGCLGGRYNRRVVFPAWGPQGELLYWQARATWEPTADGPAHVKVLNPKRPDAGEPRALTSEATVFNLFRAAAVGRGHVAICEGPISAMKAGDDAVCLWGKRLYSAQLRALIRAGVREVELMFDGPTAREPEGAWAEMLELVPMLQIFFRRVWLVRLPVGDPGDHSRAENAAFRFRKEFASGPNSRIFLL